MNSGNLNAQVFTRFDEVAQISFGINLIYPNFTRGIERAKVVGPFLIFAWQGSGSAAPVPANGGGEQPMDLDTALQPQLV